MLAFSGRSKLFFVVKFCFYVAGFYYSARVIIENIVSKELIKPFQDELTKSFKCKFSIRWLKKAIFFSGKIPRLSLNFHATRRWPNFYFSKNCSLLVPNAFVVENAQVLSANQQHNSANFLRLFERARSKLGKRILGRIQQN